MAPFEFHVEPRPIGRDDFYYVASDRTSLQIVDMPQGGNPAQNAVGQYPEIEAHMWKTYNIDIRLTFVTQLDELLIFTNGTSRWTFRRASGVVVIHELPRI